jgi:PAS domain S-box-containing protein
MSNEAHRLQAVKKFMELDDHIVADLKEIAGLAAQICNTSMSIVTLLDEDKLWFKAAIGTELSCADRELAFCNYTIKQPEVMVIPDLAKDERFSDNPLVTGAFNARFYAGAPLITKDGYALGTLCVLNTEPANLDTNQLNSLKVLAKQVVSQMELNWSLKSLEHQHHQTQVQKAAIRKSEMKLKAIFDSSRDTHILVGRDLEVLAFNKSASVFIRTTFNRKLTNGDDILQYTSPELLRQFSKFFNAALAGRSIKREWALFPGTLNECWKETSFIPVKDLNGDVIGVALNSTDITTRKRQEEQIRVQNEALQRIAIIQSHELRRPVASLLGIMDLIRMENIEFSYFDIMEITVQELDEKIRGIVKDSEDTIQGGRHLAIVA